MPPRSLLPFFAIVLSAAPATAQHAGVVELGGFGQFSNTSQSGLSSTGWGGGGRLGVFLGQRWELEADAAGTSFNSATAGGPSATLATYAGQLDFGIPFGSQTHIRQLLLEAGAGAARSGGVSNLAVPLGAGLRVMFNDVFGLRFDALGDVVKSSSQSLNPGGVATTVSSTNTNLELRAGVSFLLGNHAPAPPPPAPVVAAGRPRPAPEPPHHEPPPPPPHDNRDSLAAVNRARDALVQKVFFDFDKSELSDEQRAILDAKLPVMRANPGVRVRIEGNADERGSDEYNLALGMRRAQTARKYLVEHGIDAGRIDITSDGEERPVCQDHAESCWQQNRRDEFVIVVGDDRLLAP